MTASRQQGEAGAGFIGIFRLGQHPMTAGHDGIRQPPQSLPNGEEWSAPYPVACAGAPADVAAGVSV